MLSAGCHARRQGFAFAQAVVVVEDAHVERTTHPGTVGFDLGTGGCVISEAGLACVGPEAVLGVDLTADLEFALGGDVREKR